MKIGEVVIGEEYGARSSSSGLCRQVRAEEIVVTSWKPGLLRDACGGFPSGTLVRFERHDDPSTYLALRVELPNGVRTVLHDDDVIQPRGAVV